MITEQQFQTIPFGQKVAIVDGPDQKPVPGQCAGIAEIWARCETAEGRYFIAKSVERGALAIHGFSQVGKGFYLLDQETEETKEADQPTQLELGFYQSPQDGPVFALFIKEDLTKEQMVDLYDETKQLGGIYVAARKALVFKSLDAALEMAVQAVGAGYQVNQTLLDEAPEPELEDMAEPKLAPGNQNSAFNLLNKQEIEQRFPYGSKYSSEIDSKQAARLIRADIKAAIKEGILPKGLKVSVRSQSYTGGSSVNIRVTACPEFQILNPYRFKFEKDQPSRYIGDLSPKHPGLPRHTKEAQAVLDLLDAFHGLYNFDKSDSQSDYYHVNYFGNAEFDAAITNPEYEIIKEQLAKGEYTRYRFEGLSWTEIDA